MCSKYLVLNSFKNRHPSTAVSLKLYSPIEDSQGLSRPIGEYAHFIQQMIPSITDTIKVVPYFRDTELDNSVFLALPNIDGEDIEVKLLPSLSAEDFLGQPIIAFVDKGRPYTDKHGKQRQYYDCKFCKKWDEGKKKDISAGGKNEIPF